MTNDVAVEEVTEPHHFLVVDLDAVLGLAVDEEGGVIGAPSEPEAAPVLPNLALYVESVLWLIGEPGGVLGLVREVGNVFGDVRHTNIVQALSTLPNVVT